MALRAARKHMAGPFVWGRADCGSAACAAFADLWGIDPMMGLRGAHDGSFAVLRNVLRAGGYLALLQDYAFAAGLWRNDDPQAGDLVSIETPSRLGAALTLCIQPGEFAGKGKSGMIVTPGIIQRAWTCRN